MLLQPLEKKLIAAGAKYLNVFAASHAFTVFNPNEQLPPTTVKSGFGYDIESYTQLWIENPSNTDALTIDLEVSQLRVLSGGSSSVDIGNVPAIQKIVEGVKIALNQSVNVGNFPAEQEVTLNGEQVAVSNFPATQEVSLAAAQSLSVSNFPAEQGVSLGGEALNCVVANFPAEQEVTLNGEQIAISNFPAEQVTKPKKAQSYNPLAPADFSVGNVVIAAKAVRETLVLIAAEENTGLIWVGGLNVGIPLVSGQPFSLSTGAQITLAATVSTDTCYLAEVNE